MLDLISAVPNSIIVLAEGWDWLRRSYWQFEGNASRYTDSWAVDSSAVVVVAV